MERLKAQRLSKKIVEAILTNLEARKGVGNELENIDPNIYSDMVESLEYKVTEILCETE